MELLRTLETYLKKHTPDRIRASPCEKAKIGYALSKKTNLDILPSSCEKFMLPFQIIDRLKKLVNNDHVKMIDDCMLKVNFFAAHYVSSLNQKRRCDEVKKGFTGEQASIIIDLKIKCEPMFYREKSTQFYGERACRGTAH